MLSFVIFAQARLMLFHLLLEVAERLFAAGAHAAAGARGMQGARGQLQIQREGMFVVVKISGKHTVDVDGIGRVTLQQLTQLAGVPADLLFDRLVCLDVLVADRNVHGRTC